MTEDIDLIKIKPIKILIAEDDQASEFLLSSMVKSFSKRILKANSGEEAILLCKNNPDINLILMDIELNGMNGYTAAQEIRNFNKNIIIIAQTANVFVEKKKEALYSGCNDYISKPINKDLLLSKIRSYFPE